MESTIERLLALAEAARDELVTLTAEAVRVRSVSGDEREMGAWFEARCRALGLETEAWPVDETRVLAHPAAIPVEYGYTDHRNIEAFLRGRTGGRRLILFGHTDTVPVDPRTTWAHDPYGGDVADGRIYGRGSADMKAGCAVALVALRILRDSGVQLDGDVTAQLIVDEEAGGNGTLDAVLAGRYPPGSACIMLEPTSPDVLLISGRGAQFFRIRVPGQEGGTEYYRDLVNAIDPAIVLFEAVKRYALMREASVAGSELYASHGRQKVPLAITTFQAGAWPSTLAGEAVLEGTIECLPGEDIHAVTDAFEAYLREVAAGDPWLREHPFRFERFGLWFDAAALDPEDAFVVALRRAAVQAIGREPEVTGGGGSDLRLPLVYASCPTVLWGPAGGPIHSVDEWVDIEQMVEMLKVCLVAAVEWCGPAGEAAR